MDTVNGIEWKRIEHPEVDGRESNVSWHADVPEGHISILDRMTGYTGMYGFGLRDTETGFRDKDGKFWLASGMFDIRDYATDTIPDAIRRIKKNSNTCRGQE